MPLRKTFHLVAIVALSSATVPEIRAQDADGVADGEAARAREVGAQATTTDNLAEQGSERPADIDDGAGSDATAAAPQEEAEAMEAPSSDEQRRMPDRPIFTLRGGAGHSFGADLDDSPGNVSITRSDVGMSVFAPVNRQIRLTGGANAEWSWYDFTNASGLVPGTSDPIDRALITDLNLTAFIAMGRKWSWFAGGRVRFAGEDGADLGDSISGGGTLGARHQFTEAFALTFGLSGTTRLEDSALAFPFVGIEWEITDDVRLTSRGPGLELTSRLTEEIELSVSGAWELREIRLSDSGPLPDGVLRDARVPIEVGFAWRPARNINVRLSGGAILWQRYRFDDSDGSQISKVNGDATPFIGLRGSIRF